MQEPLIIKKILTITIGILHFVQEPLIIIKKILTITIGILHFVQEPLIIKKILTITIGILHFVQEPLIIKILTITIGILHFMQEPLKIKSHNILFVSLKSCFTDLYLTIGQNRLSQFPFQANFKVSTSTPAKSTHNISSNSMADLCLHFTTSVLNMRLLSWFSLILSYFDKLKFTLAYPLNCCSYFSLS